MTDLATIEPTANSSANHPASLERFFGQTDDMLSLWIAEPYTQLASEITSAIEQRAAVGWYGYEARPPQIFNVFWEWMASRHGWTSDGLTTTVSPSIGTSLGVMMEQHTSPGDGIILQPPVFTDFKPLVNAAKRSVVRNALVLTDDGYRMDLEDLADKAADPATRMMILCNPHNPVGRLWTADELRSVAEICEEHDVLVIADEIHADLALPPHTFTPFASVASDAGTSWAALHGPIKTFGVAGLCDTLLITDDPDIAKGFRNRSSQLHLTRNNVFGLAAFEAGYSHGGPWVAELMELVATNVALLDAHLPTGIQLVRPEATFLAWLDFRQLDLGVPGLVEQLGAVKLALSPGHWFGREGAGFARMTIAAPTSTIEDAIGRMSRMRA